MILKGTKFQIKVWEFLKTIPNGTVTTYSKVAEAIGYPKAVRAVANAIGNNPNPIIIPCHRVVRSDGTIGGYSGIGGINKKKSLLRKENIKLNQLLKYVN
jgi:methylated-DNA-[protein]-cysteine S-methyltransferase